MIFRFLAYIVKEINKNKVFCLLLWKHLRTNSKDFSESHIKLLFSSLPLSRWLIFYVYIYVRLSELYLGSQAVEEKQEQASWGGLLEGVTISKLFHRS